MIEKMKKLTLLVGEKEKGKFLLALRKAGVVHIEESSNQEVKSLIVLRKKMEHIDKAMRILTAYGDTGETDPQKLKDHDIQGKIDMVLKAEECRVKSLQELENRKKEEKWFELWGKVNPQDIEYLKDRDIHVKLYRIRKAEYQKAKNRDSLKIINADKEYYYVSLVSYKAEKGLFQEEIPFPDMTYNALKNTMKSLEEGVQSSEQNMRSCVGLKKTLMQYMKKIEKSRRFQAVRYGMKGEGAFSVMEGYCPEKDLKKVLGLSQKEGFGYMVEEPGKTRGVPTKITNPAWIKIIDPVFKFMNTVPGYDEFDISMVFLLFFSVFFALLIGDAGYGLLFLGATYFIRKKAQKAPREPFFLMYVLSLSTIVWGAVTGTWFGAEEIAKLPVLNNLVIERVNSFVSGNQNFMMYICFLIGAIHLTIAHWIKAVRLINSPRMVAEIGWISIIWGMFYAAGTLVIDRSFPGFAGFLIVGGIVTVLFFANFQKNIIKGILATLADLPLSVISAFSDVVSYLRLFAVGYASVVVAQSFNDMAIGSGVNSFIGGLSAALILFCGHVLNIILGFMAVIVHGIRLNMLEFSGHLGMQWSGKEYKPFKE